MNIAFRTNANFAVGSGHLRRCLTLASALKETASDAQIYFLTSGSAEYHKLISEMGFSPIDIGSSLSIDEDLQETIKAVFDHKLDVLIVDNYGINENYLRNLKPRVKLLVIIDDFMHIKQYSCHILVNLNLYAHLLDYHCDKDTQMLLGTEFVQLRKEFDSYSDFKRENPETVKHILVSFGGSDIKGVTIFAVKALKKLKENFLVYVITGRSFRRGEELAQLVGLDSRFVILPEVSDMARRMEKIDLAISSPSWTFYALAFFKTACVLICYVDNQKLILDYAGKNGLAVAVGEIGSIDVDELTSALSKLINDKESRDNLSRRLDELVDGLGRYRLAESILSSFNDRNTAKIDDSADDEDGNKQIDDK